MVAFYTRLKQTVTLVEKRVKDKSSDDPLKDLTFLSDHYSSRHEWDKANAATRHMLALAEGDLNSNFETTPLDIEFQQSRAILRRLNGNRKLIRFTFAFVVIMGIWCAALELIDNPQILLNIRAQIFAHDPQTFVDRANYFLNQNKLNDAISECDKALTLDPVNSNALQKKSLVLLNMGQYQLASKFNLLSTDRKNGSYFYNLAGIQASLGDHKDAAVTYEKWNALSPDSNNLYAAAYEWARAGDSEKALQLAQLETEIGKTDYEKAQGLSQQARYLLRLSRYQEAIEASTKSINLGNKPLVSRAFTYRAEAQYHLSSYKAALDDASTAIIMNWEDVRAYEIRAKCFDMLGQPSDASADRNNADVWRNGRDI